MSANTLAQVNLLWLLEEATEKKCALFERALVGLVATRVDVAVFDDLNLEAAAGAVDADTEALPGGVGSERVGHAGAGAVLDENIHGVLDRNTVPKDTLISVISVLVLSIEIHCL
jgi:hypothetical protein